MPEAFVRSALVICVLSAAVVVYAYAGYPVAICLCAKLSARRGSRRAARPAIPEPPPCVSVLLPAFNAAAILPRKVQSLLAQSYPAEQLEILVYCDGCSDDTESVARALAGRPELEGRMRVFADSVRRGKPTALNILAKHARGQFLMLNDVRQTLSPNAADALVKAFVDPSVGCSSGRLVLAGSSGSGAYWRYEDWIRSQESQFRGVVGMTGAIAMMRREDFSELPADIVLDDVWMPMQLVLQGRRVVSVRDAEAHDEAFEDDKEFGRKARTLAGNFQLFARQPALISPLHNPIWFETVSHKVLRLFVPWALVLLLVASAALSFAEDRQARELGVLAVGVQLGFYGMAALGPWAGRGARLARTFVVLNAAAAVGLFRFLLRSQRITW